MRCAELDSGSAHSSLPEPTRWRWQRLRGLAGIDRLAAAWNALARAGGLFPTADAVWARCYWRAFGGADRQLDLHALYDGDRLIAVLPLRRTGRLLRAWCPPANTKHTPYWMFAMAEDRPDAAGVILQKLLGSAELIDLRPMRASGPLCAALTAAAEAASVTVCKDHAGGDVVVELIRPWQRLRSSLRKKVVTNTTRRQRHLEKLGKLSFDVVRGRGRLGRVLQECFALEAMGWKGSRGSPIAARPQTARFYTELAFEASGADRLAIYTLRLDGGLIAFDYCLRGQGAVTVLKESYHPKWARYSPGNVLRLMLLQREVEAGQATSYHLGVPLQWKLPWATRVEPLVRLRIYRRSPLAALSYRSGPWLRGRLRSIPPLRRAVRWGRAAMGRAD